MLCTSSMHVFTDVSDSNSTQSFLLCVKVYHIHNFVIGVPVCYAVPLFMCVKVYHIHNFEIGVPVCYAGSQLMYLLS